VPGSLRVTDTSSKRKHCIQRTVSYGAFLAQQKTGIHLAGASRARPSLPLRCMTTRRLSAGDLTSCFSALIMTTIIISSGLARDLHGQKVICRHGIAFIFIRHLRHRRRLRSQFHRNLAGSSSPCFTGLSLDLTNYGNSFSGVRTWEWGGEPASQRNSSFWEGRGEEDAVKETSNE
jgi:hypothetical protein